MTSLSLRLGSASERSLTMVFEDIQSTEVSGGLSKRELSLKMFFRQPRSGRAQGSVTFNSLDLEATLSLLNLQNVADFTVTNSYFRQVMMMIMMMMMMMMTGGQPRDCPQRRHQVPQQRRQQQQLLQN